MEKGLNWFSAKNIYNVFVVEDSDVYRTLLVENIAKINNSLDGEAASYVIHSFSSGEEALDNLRLHPDVVVLDYRLDSGGYLLNMDGLALLKKLKGISPLTEVIVLSCQTSVEVVKELLKAGASHYIKKDNFSQLRVSHLIENFIRKKEEKSHQKKSNLLKAGLFFIVAMALAMIMVIYFINN